MVVLLKCLFTKIIRGNNGLLSIYIEDLKYHILTLEGKQRHLSYQSLVREKSLIIHITNFISYSGRRLQPYLETN